jgi:anthranilate synthase/phosphoribosyltransferase
VILVIDNYDSFTFNLVQALQAAGADVRVIRNDQITAAEVEAMAADPAQDLRGIVISPGPGDPDDAGVSVETVRIAAARRIPLLGVCLGMQSMGAAFGAAIVRAPTLVHGEASAVAHDGRGMLAGMPADFPAARYHSLCVDPATLPAELYVTATSPEDGVVMGIRHRDLPLEGVQFHPESVLTPDGPHLLANFLRLAGEGEASRLDAASGSFATRGMAMPETPTRIDAVAAGAAVAPVGAGPASPAGSAAPPSPAASVAPATPAPVPAPAAAPTGEAVRSALATIVEGGTLTLDEAHRAMGAVMDGEATPSQLAAMLMGLRMRGETVAELAGFALAMRERAVKVEAPAGTIDIVGTGGDGSNTFNISTTAALVVAACGVPVAKHGNRAITSRSGSADVLDALGIRIDHDAESAGRAIRELGFAFLFAPAFHPAMRYAGPTRRELGVRTAFNLLGPLTNPAGATRALIGVGDWAAAPKIAEVFHLLGTERTLVVAGKGVDELPLDGTGVIWDVTPAGIERRECDPGPLGLLRTKTAALGGASPAENAALTEGVLRGEPGARRDVVLLNAGAALVAAGVVGTIEDGIDRASLTVDAGLAIELLKALRAERRTADSEAAKAAKAARAANQGTRA